MRIGRLCARRACAILCFGWLALPALATPPAPPLLLAEVYDEAVDPAAYWVSEKLDGVRAYWDGRQLYFRSGQAVAAPAWFTANFPAQPLDGELWLGRGQFDRLSAIVRKQTPDDADWRAVRYLIFELPNAPGSFSARVAAIERLLAQTGVAWLQAVRQFRVADRGELFTRLDAVVAGGGEGLMLHRADAAYRAGRGDDLLKLKPYLDREATVIAHLPGEGRHAGRLGALLVEDGGHRFRLGSGFTDAQRERPPPLGSHVTYRYRGLTATGLPRFATFLRVHETF